MNKLFFLILYFISLKLQAQEKNPEVLMQELARSLDNEFVAFKLADSHGDKKMIAHAYGNIGSIYLDIAKLPSEHIHANNQIPAEKKENLIKSIEYSDRSAKVSEEVGDAEQLKTAYQNKYAAQMMAGKVKDAMATYTKLTSLKHNILSSKKNKEMALKQSEYEHKKREDSIRHEKELAEQHLSEQNQKLTEQQKQLETTNKTLTQTQKEKENVSNQLQQTQTDLSVEKTNSEETTRQLTLAEEEKRLQDANLQLKQNELLIKDKDIAERKKEQYIFILGFVVLLVFTFLIYRSFNLQKKFNTALLTEKKRSEKLLLNILPAEVASELRDKGYADAKQFDNVTVLFTDFVNFTTVTESMTPKQLVNELHICFKAFDEILGKYHIEKIKTVGDAYLAVSGLPIANPKHAVDTVEAAIEIRDFMIAREKEMGKNTFTVRIGINSGNVVAGIVGVRKYSYDIWGDTVNTAARMEQNSQAGKVNISQTTYELVKDKFNCEYRGEIEAKNKGQLKMYYVS